MIRDDTIDFFSIDLPSDQTNLFTYCSNCGRNSATESSSDFVGTCSVCKKKLINKPGYHLYFPKKINEKGLWYYSSYYNDGIDLELTEISREEEKKQPQEKLIRVAWGSKLLGHANNRDQARINFSYMQRIRSSNHAEKKVIELDHKIDDLNCAVQENSNEVASKIKNDPQLLKEYLKHLLDLETEYYSVRQHLLSLYRAQSDVFEEYTADRYLAGSRKTNELNELYSRMNELNKKTIDVKMTWNQERPQEPVPPIYPELKKANLLNKKKVQAENSILIKEYESKMQKYHADMELYETAIKAYNEAKEVFDAQKKRAEEIENEKILNLKKDLNKRIAEVSAKDAEEYYSASVSAHKSFVEKEIDTAETVLFSLIDGKNQLYSTGIVFSKYHNLLAISSFYEYLMSGRCNSLEGSGGAYNIYEDEIRANQIITQLSEVIDSLETIKSNQYMIYSQIRSVNTGLETLNSKLSKVMDTMDSIKCTNEITAYNTAVTAYYAKKNTELTNALGFMIALK